MLRQRIEMLLNTFIEHEERIQRLEVAIYSASFRSIVHHEEYEDEPNDEEEEKDNDE